MANRIRPTAAQLWSVGPARGDHRGALRVGASVLAPLVVLLLVGHLEWAVYATFGAFASIYGRALGYAERTGMQLTAAATMVISVVLGTTVSLLPGAAWISVCVGALVALGMAGVSQALSWHPPGPLFQVFAFTACASVPAHPTTVPIALGLSVASAFSAVIIGRVGSLRLGRAFPREIIWPRRLRLEIMPLARYFVAPLIAGLLALTFGWGHTYWAMVAAVVPLAGTDTAGRLARAGQRLGGTLVGVVLAAGVLSLHTSGLLAVVIIVVLQVGAELLIGRNYALALIFVTPLALMMGELARRHPSGPLLRDRALETILGVAVAVALTLLTHGRMVLDRRRSATSEPEDPT